MEKQLDGNSVKKCKNCLSQKNVFDEKKQIYNTGDATVEVTVKLKRRKSAGPNVAEVPLPYRKGSWGDLLSQSKAVEFPKSEKESTKRVHISKDKQKSPKCTFPDVCHNSKSNCLKIPITDELYLETHTHVGKNQEPKKSRLPSAKYALIKENEELRKQKSYLEREVDRMKIRKKQVKPEEYFEAPERLQKPPKQSYEAQISLPNKTEVDRRIAQTQTQTESLISQKPVSPPISLDRSLEMENAALRREADQLFAEMNKAKQEQQEYLTTIKELYQLAEILKTENQMLHGTQEEKQKMQERLIEALGENHVLKQHLDSLMIAKQSETIPEDRVSKIRSVIKDVRTTIAQEIQGIEQQRKTSTGLKRDKGFDFNVSGEVSGLLNDTNSSEIQGILNAKDPPPPLLPISEDRSSTQYYGVPNSSSKTRPSPLHTQVDVSPKISTPNYEMSHVGDSVDMRLGTGDGHFRSASGQSKKYSPGNEKMRSEQDLYRIDSCRSFVPLPVDIIHDDSNSDYRSSSSSVSSVNHVQPN